MLIVPCVVYESTIVLRAKNALVSTRTVCVQCELTMRRASRLCGTGQAAFETLMQQKVPECDLYLDV